MQTKTACKHCSAAVGLLEVVEATTAILGVFGDTESDLPGLASMSREVFSRMRPGARWGLVGAFPLVSGLCCGT